ncbi:hypothetical protein [Streptomyces sp. NPDC001594]|uniref:hypothetical protein n=1 Tax=Streptomyces sp. NPDC001594 TaxID=3364590 RepID=UPI0036BC14DF
MDAVALYGLTTGRAAAPAVAWATFCLAQLALAAHALCQDGDSLRHLWLVTLHALANGGPPVAPRAQELTTVQGSERQPMPGSVIR